MTYRSLEEHLDNILKTVRLNANEKHVMKMIYLNPGMSTLVIKGSSNVDMKTLEDLKKQGLLLLHENEDGDCVYPIPLAILCTKANPKADGDSIIRCQDALKTIDKWMKYPVMRAKDARMKTSTKKETILKWIFDIHQTDWDSVYCFGDYESFINDIGIDPEVEWIKERAKKGRNAMVFATQDGEWAQRINTLQREELRDCCITPGDFTDLFIMSFPDIYTTVIAGKDKDITFIHSKSISQHYAGIVKEGILTDKST
jgi:hypothetical protein